MEKSFLSDLYYADVYDSEGEFSSWDTNQNSFYGEYDHNGETDMMDLYPDPKICSKYMQSQPGIKKGTKIKKSKYRKLNNY